MKNFASAFPILSALLIARLGEGNFSSVYEEESDSFLMSSGNLGLLNNEVAGLKTQLTDANTAYEAQEGKHSDAVAELKAAHATELEAKATELKAVQDELATLKGKTLGADPTNTGQQGDVNAGGDNAGLPSWCDPKAAHNQIFTKK